MSRNIHLKSLTVHGGKSYHLNGERKRERSVTQAPDIKILQFGVCYATSLLIRNVSPESAAFPVEQINSINLPRRTDVCRREAATRLSQYEEAADAAMVAKSDRYTIFSACSFQNAQKLRRNTSLLFLTRKTRFCSSLASLDSY